VHPSSPLAPLAQLLPPAYYVYSYTPSPGVFLMSEVPLYITLPAPLALTLSSCGYQVHELGCCLGLANYLVLAPAGQVCFFFFITLEPRVE